jgi:tripartite-type tricarboxylate transporter receptor subunit TctC
LGRVSDRLLALILVSASLGAVAWSVKSEAATSAYPTKAIRFIVPYTPGSSGDIFARAISQKMSEAWGQPVIIDNRGGSGGMMGSEMAAKAPSDGHTLMLGGTSNIAINPALYSKLPYDPVRDFVPVTLVASSPYVMIVNPSVPARTVPEFIALAKARPGQLNYASTGSGSTVHLTAELFASMAGVKLVHVPYKNQSGRIVDVMAGEVQMMFAGTVLVQPHMKTGRVRALGITSAKRSPLMPDLPTIAESGLKGFESDGWFGVFVPAGTSRAIVMQLNAEIVRALKSPEMGERFAREGAELFGNSPEEFAAFVKNESAKWSRAVKMSGARPD